MRTSLTIVLFAPLGFLLPVVFPQVSRFRQVTAIALMVSLFLEGVQLLTGLGSFDVDDLLLNVTGAIGGWVLLRAISVGR